MLLAWEPRTAADSVARAAAGEPENRSMNVSDKLKMTFFISRKFNLLAPSPSIIGNVFSDNQPPL